MSKKVKKFKSLLNAAKLKEKLKGYEGANFGKGPKLGTVTKVKEGKVQPNTTFGDGPALKDPKPMLKKKKK